MGINTNFPTREEAEKILSWGNEQSPGPWANHCRVVARAAEKIAEKCGLNTEKAYVSGLLHDIGYNIYRDGKGKTDHIFSGYDLMTEKGYDDIARICLSHSFSCQDINTFASSYIKCSDAQMDFIVKFLSEVIYDDYDKLIQLCDSLGLAHGVVIIEKRLMDVVRRHGFKDSTFVKWDSIFALKDYFDKKCGINIYNLFYDEIKNSIFG